MSFISYKGQGSTIPPLDDGELGWAWDDKELWMGTGGGAGTNVMIGPNAGSGSGDVTGPSGGVEANELTVFADSSGKVITGSNINKLAIDDALTKLTGIEAGAEVNTVDTVNTQTGTVVITASDVGLGNVDNTTDLLKPISTDTQTALNLKENTLTWDATPIGASTNPVTSGGLFTEFATKAESSHDHVLANITDFPGTSEGVTISKFLRSVAAGPEWVEPGVFTKVKYGVTTKILGKDTGAGTLEFTSDGGSVGIIVTGGGTDNVTVNLEAGSGSLPTLVITNDQADALLMEGGGIEFPGAQLSTSGIRFETGLASGTFRTIKYQDTGSGSMITASTNFGSGGDIYVNSLKDNGNTARVIFKGGAASALSNLEYDGTDFSFPESNLTPASIKKGTDTYVLTSTATAVEWQPFSGADWDNVPDMWINPTYQESSGGGQISTIKFGLDSVTPGNFPSMIVEHGDLQNAQFYFNRVVRVDGFTSNANISATGDITAINGSMSASAGDIRAGLSVYSNQVGADPSGFGSFFAYDNGNDDGLEIRGDSVAHEWDVRHRMRWKAWSYSDAGLSVGGISGGLHVVNGAPFLVDGGGNITIQDGGLLSAEGDAVDADAGIIMAGSHLYVNRQGHRDDSTIFFYDETSFNTSWIKKSTLAAGLFRFSDGLDIDFVNAVELADTFNGAYEEREEDIRTIRFFKDTLDTNGIKTTLARDGTTLLVKMEAVAGATTGTYGQVIVTGSLDNALHFTNVSPAGIRFEHDGKMTFNFNGGVHAMNIEHTGDGVHFNGSVSAPWVFDYGLTVGTGQQQFIEFVGANGHNGYISINDDGEMLVSPALRVAGTTTMTGKLSLVGVGATIEADKGLWIDPTRLDTLTGTIMNIEFGYGVTTNPALEFENGLGEGAGLFRFNRPVELSTVTSKNVAIRDEVVPSSQGILTFDDGTNIISTDKGLYVAGPLTFDSILTHPIVGHDTLATGAQLTTLTGGGNADSLHVHASGAGDVVGPASAVDSNFAAFDTTTGKLIKDSLVPLADVGLNTTHRGLTDNPHAIAAFTSIYDGVTLVPADALDRLMFAKTNGISISTTDDATFGPMVTVGLDATANVTFSTVTASFLTANNGVFVSTIYEKTADAGVTIDGLLIKAGDVPALITGRTEETAPTSDDFVLIYENTGGGHRKVALSNLPTGSAVYSDETGAVVADVHNVTGSTITAGTPVYISGYNVGLDLVEIAPADASAVATMPALGLVRAGIATGSSGIVDVMGSLNNVDTSGWTVGDPLYVSETTGTLTNTRPTGATVHVQKMGLVLRSHATLGIIGIIGAGRTNDVPNIADGKFWQGDSTGVAAEVSLDEVIQISIEGTVDEKQPYTVPFDMTITGWNMFLDVTGSMAIGVWTDTYANYPPTVADVIVTPSVTSAIKNQATGLSISLTKGEIIMFNVNSVTTAGVGTICLIGVRT